MKLELLFFKAVVLIMAVPALAACIYIYPEIAQFFVDQNPKLGYLYYHFLFGLYLATIAYFGALQQTVKLLTYIEKGEAFSDLSALALNKIKGCILIIGALHALFITLMHLAAEMDDALGMILIGWFVLFVCAVIAAFVAGLQIIVKESVKSRGNLNTTI